MKSTRILLIVLGVALASFAAGWAFQGYHKPEAAIDYINQRYFCN